MPYFSIVIPLYNKENYIAATLHSVLSQTFTDFEVLVINDVSTDNSVNIAQTFSNKRVKIINHSVNKGLSASRNTGIKNAKANYIALIDADDVWKPNFLEKIHEMTLNLPDAGLYATNYEEVYSGNTVIQSPQKLESGIITYFFHHELSKHIYCYSSVCIKREVFNEIGYFDESITMGEDVDFNVRANLKFKVAYYNKPLARITMFSENQITHSSLRNKVIIDHDKFEKENPQRADLKKYLDFHRYTMAKRYKLSGDFKNYAKMAKGISPHSLNYKQKLLLYSPAIVLKAVKAIKNLLAKTGFNPTTY